MKKILSVLLVCVLAFSFAACGKKAADYSAYEEYVGSYWDEYSQRAYAEFAIDEEEGPQLKIWWSSSAYQKAYWVMNVELKDGNFLYDEISYCVLTFDADDNCTEEDAKTFGSGCISIQDGKLCMAGCSDSGLSECIFAKE